MSPNDEWYLISISYNVVGNISEGPTDFTWHSWKQGKNGSEDYDEQDIGEPSASKI